MFRAGVKREPGQPRVESHPACVPQEPHETHSQDAGRRRSIRHRGGGSDPVGIRSMISYVEQRYNTDPNRIFATGVSSGAMITNVMLGVYPDVFAAGASFAGVPFTCFATTGGSEWNSQCSGGQIVRTPQQWGDAVRNSLPGYSGPWPRMQIWHGTNDDTLRYPNFAEQIKQWTNVHGLSQTPTYTDSPQGNYTRTRYGSSGGMAPVEAISMQGTGHNLPVDAAQVIRFFGLDGTAPPTTAPPTTAPPTTAPPTTPPPSGACRVTYGVNAWNNGLVASVTIANTGSGAVTARNMSYNATISPNGSQSIGFQATHSGNSGRPSSFTLNGTPPLRRRLMCATVVGGRPDGRPTTRTRWRTACSRWELSVRAA
ncbi:cellulose binding domain-containing protein [Solwaraspora sp. WMMA2080]|nr:MULTISPECIES: PHB depolymerase family esterase [unclassified Solwaraspora]WBC00165.1 cellulose binding domain-containing protein [Solwaraspora sp. WMMA2059]WBC23768.1 cellulose binding domain-containing protein [Solwaraspora sp. WMMA2080]